MKILVLGATGFLGRNVARTLAEAGHAVVAGGRARAGAQGGISTGAGAAAKSDAEAVGVRAASRHGPASIEWRAVDFNQADTPEAWRPLLADIDVVINAVGIFRESPGKTFRQLHELAPRALFTACQQAGVRRVIQVSALGADEQAQTAYHRSKRAADVYLLSLPIDAVVVQPSLVYGPGGGSAGLFGMFATLPLIPAPDIGAAKVQPIHVDDLVAAIVALVDAAPAHADRIALVGPEPLSWREFLAGLRTALGVPGRARFIPIPAGMASLAARVADRWPRLPFDSNAWRMLLRGNCADAGPVQGLLGRPPRGIAQFVSDGERPAQRGQAQLSWLLPVLRLSLACLWIVTGVLSLGIYPVESSYALLQRTGVPGWLQPAALYGAALLDIALGVLTLAPRRTHRLWAVQAGLILAYTAIISWRLPEFWLHPYGPILKNLPLLALLWLLYEWERPWNTR